jgi:hypothetical protein
MDKNFWDFKNLEKQQGQVTEIKEESGGSCGLEVFNF